MSEGQRMPLQDARKLASEIVGELEPGCSRIMVAGSVRREKESVGDLEIVCISQSSDLFESGSLMTVDGVVRRLAQQYAWKVIKNGPLMKQIDLGAIKLDLFITTPAQWGVIYLLRTGSAEFSKWVVTKRKWGGALPSFMDIGGGRVLVNGAPIDTPEEDDVFRAIRLKWIEPKDRSGPLPRMLIV